MLPFIIFVLLFRVSTMVEENAVPRRALVASSSKILEVPAFGFYGHGQCDRNGNLFFHTTTTDFNDPTILELASGSWEPTIFKASDSTTRMYFGDFSVTPSGEVWILGNSGETDREQYVFKFDSDGTMTGRTQLDVPVGVDVEDFAVSDRGVILVSGFFGPKAAKQLQSQNFVGLFHSSGKLLRRLGTDFKAVELQEVNKSIHAGSALFGDDGYLYLLHERTILVISEAGSLVRRISFDVPDKGSVPTKIAVSGGWIAIWLSGRNDQSLVSTKLLVLDAQTEEPYAIYSPPPEDVHHDAPCFNKKEGFSFIGVQGGRMTITRAALR